MPLAAGGAVTDMDDEEMRDTIFLALEEMVDGDDDYMLRTATPSDLAFHLNMYGYDCSEFRIEDLIRHVKDWLSQTDIRQDAP